MRDIKRHDRPDGSGECDYVAAETLMAFCNKCGWTEMRSTDEIKRLRDALRKIQGSRWDGGYKATAKRMRAIARRALEEEPTP